MKNKNNRNIQANSLNKNRIYALDTIKAILIFLVVFGHLIKQYSTEGITKLILCNIYIFHMPFFVFCSGYLFKYNNKKMIRRILLPYFIFQTIYTIFNCLYLQNQPIKLDYTTPFWIMWYLLALFMWGITAQLLDTKNIKKQCIIIITFLVLGIIVGFDNSIGYYLSLSRFFVFIPFFMFGYYLKKDFNIWELKNKIKKYQKYILGAVFLILLCAIIYFIFLKYDNWNIQWLNSSYSYEQANYNFTFRLIQYVFATIIIACALWIIPNKKNIFQYIGRNTLTIFLVHGFIIKIIFKNDLLKYNSLHEFYIKSFIITLLITLITPLPIIGFKKVIELIKKTSYKKKQIKSYGNT